MPFTLNRKMKTFIYGSKETTFLKNADGNMKSLIERFGHIERQIYDSLFECLVSSVVGQQISGKALDTILLRLKEKANSICPENINSLSAEDIKLCGMSFRKATNIKSLACKFLSGEVDAAAFCDMTDDEVVAKLVTLDGIGKWTAEMALIFALNRKNVMSFGDFGIRKGLQKLYGKQIDKELFEFYRQKFSPYGTIASFYLWALANEK